jgi:hypothetical protein
VLLLFLAPVLLGGCAHQALPEARRDAPAACAEIPEADLDRNMCPDSRLVVRVEPYQDWDGKGKFESFRRVGAVIVLRAEPGMTAEYLQRLADCYLARSAARPSDELARSSCPLAVRDANVSVLSSRGGFAIVIRASSSPVADVVLARAQGLLTR